MKKDELIEVARRELGMGPSRAQSETVTTLREKIRARREMVKVSEDPLSTLPKGLDKMDKAHLEEQVRFRDLTAIPEKATRAQLIIAIRDDVENRNLLDVSTTEWTQVQTTTEDDDSEMTAARSSKMRR